MAGAAFRGRPLSFVPPWQRGRRLLCPGGKPVMSAGFVARLSIRDAARTPTFAPSPYPANRLVLFHQPSPAHPADAGNDLEGHHRRYPLCGQKVSASQIMQHAGGQYLRVRGASALAVSVPGRMVGPVSCAGPGRGSQGADLAGPADLKRLFTLPASSTHAHAQRNRTADQR